MIKKKALTKIPVNRNNKPGLIACNGHQDALESYLWHNHDLYKIVDLTIITGYRLQSCMEKWLYG